MNSLLFTHPLNEEESITAGLKQFNGRRMARRRRQSLVPRNQGSPEFFDQHDVGRIIGRKLVTQLPNPGKEHEVRIPGHA